MQLDQDFQGHGHTAARCLNSSARHAAFCCSPSSRGVLKVFKQQLQFGGSFPPASIAEPYRQVAQGLYNTIRLKGLPEAVAARSATLYQTPEGPKVKLVMGDIIQGRIDVNDPIQDEVADGFFGDAHTRFTTQHRRLCQDQSMLDAYNSELQQVQEICGSSSRLRSILFILGSSWKHVNAGNLVEGIQGRFVIFLQPQLAEIAWVSGHRDP